MSRPPNIEASLRTLADYLKANITGIDVLHEFPDPTRKLRYPSIALSGAAPRQLTFDLAGASATEKEYDTEAPVDGIYAKVPVKYLVGSYDFSFQMDIWTNSKASREALYEKIFEVMNPNIQPMGLVLTLTEYFGQKCSYEITGFDAMGDEQAAQRGEWRLRVPLVATCHAIRGRREFIIKNVEVITEIPDNIEEEGEG